VTTSVLLTLAGPDLQVRVFLGSAGAIQSATPAAGIPRNAAFLEGFAEASSQNDAIDVSLDTVIEKGVDVRGMLPVFYVAPGGLHAWPMPVSAIHIAQPASNQTDGAQSDSEEVARQIDAVDQYQRIADTPDGHKDDEPIGLTVFQAEKLAAIISAGRRGFTVYDDNIEGVAMLLRTLALETVHGHAFKPAMPSAEIWDALNTLPWPVPGTPRSQPDAQS
jgi:hypothetical protein